MPPYLFHNTQPAFLIPILESGELRSSALTGNAEHGHGAAEYDSNHFVYLSATDTLFDPAIYGFATLYIDSAALSDRKFSVANYHTPAAPHRAGERPCPRSLLPRTEYTHVYARGFAGRDAVLSALARESKAAFPPRGEGFQIPNQVAVRNRLDVRGMVRGVCFHKESVCHYKMEAFVAYVRRAYPDLPVRVSSGPRRAWADSVYSFYRRGSVNIGRDSDS